MDFTRKQEPVISDLDLSELIQEMVDFCESTAERHHVRVVCQVPAGLPLVRGDRVQLEQVLLNLIVNAIEASAYDCEEPFATVRVKADDQVPGHVCVRVEDQGGGISEADLPRLFDRFFSTKQSGLGMGLAISRTLVENLGGELWAENLPERGARFSFTLDTAD